MTEPSILSAFDEERLIAAVDLVGRTGAQDFQVGYLHDDVPVERAGWYAHAQYRGARITVEDHPGPIEAAEALAVRLLTSARCQHCQGLVALSSEGALLFPNARMVDGTTFTEAQARAVPFCRWRRIGRRWERGCVMAPRRSGSARKQSKAARKRRKR